MEETRIREDTYGLSYGCPELRRRSAAKFKVVYTEAFMTESLETSGNKRQFSDIISE